MIPSDPQHIHNQPAPRTARGAGVFFAHTHQFQTNYLPFAPL